MPSAVIAKYEYDPDMKRLVVYYQTGKIYAYLNVPEEVYREMRSTLGKGIYLNRHIKGKYNYVDITPGGQGSLSF